MEDKLKRSWTLRFLYYFLILLALFFLYGFQDANSGTYIYNEF
ncbi:hypothetical protein A374_00390 [Fictibacillus macauensis ZFHKF-1]|uniref:D-Ala-teichoic acid biosynthesis protein n=1 Tax=Fictibacillus macauensis ZFHKF-1 TaxID=1196324 RepID=I8J6E2_9BACL|nr:teichoic acid D-Ala incorporation-associated protein DltX [Fictibacillus macauensis]EIT87386.1 hypothetical protein A374_00390 [Fictibacillus macauensis ZFHKF-1]